MDLVRGKYEVNSNVAHLQLDLRIRTGADVDHGWCFSCSNCIIQVEKQHTKVKSR